MCSRLHNTQRTHWDVTPLHLVVPGGAGTDHGYQQRLSEGSGIPTHPQKETSHRRTSRYRRSSKTSHWTKEAWRWNSRKGGTHEDWQRRPGPGCWGSWPHVGVRELFGLVKISCVVEAVMLQWKYAFVSTHWTVYLNRVHLTVCQETSLKSMLNNHTFEAGLKLGIASHPDNLTASE